jgi:hypothetical protein
MEAVSSWPEYETVADAERVRDHIEEALEVFGTPAYGYVAVTPKSMEDEPAFAASVGVASMMKLLNNYDHLLDEETEEVFEETKERLSRFEEARMRMGDK